MGILETESCRQTARAVNDQITVKTHTAKLFPITGREQGTGVM